MASSRSPNTSGSVKRHRRSWIKLFKALMVLVKWNPLMFMRAFGSQQLPINMYSKHAAEWPHSNKYGVYLHCFFSGGDSKVKWQRRSLLFGSRKTSLKKKSKIILSTASYLNHYWALFWGNILLSALMYSLSVPEQSIPVHAPLPSEETWRADVKEHLNRKPCQ